MEWNMVKMSVIASLVFLVVFLFNLFIVYRLPPERRPKK